ncbi:MAG TPA: response regulator, partial [Labilithrix sp.]|nr:response regulator [Labilithrix sp.]
MFSTTTDREQDGTARAEEAPPPREAVEQARILLVDDDESSRGGLARLLAADGYAIATASDGLEALEEARRTRPDLVLTDLEMPRMHGVELCRRLHELDRTLPVIVMTGHADMQSAVASLRAGAEDYLTKPLQYDAVLWRVQRALARRAATVELETLQRALNERLVLSNLREQEHASAEAQHRAQVDALLGNLKEGVVIAEKGGRVLMVNQAARDILGVDEHDPRGVYGLGSLEVEGPGKPSRCEEQNPLLRALRGEPFVDFEVRCTRPDGERRHLVSTGTSVRGDDGEVAMAIVVFRDVTETRHHQRQREEYLALVSHDLLNPLSNILMGASVLKQSLEARGLTADVKLAERVERNVGRMTAMLTELTEATTLESRGVALQLERCILGEIVAGIIDGMGEGSARR